MLSLTCLGDATSHLQWIDGCTPAASFLLHLGQSSTSSAYPVALVGCGFGVVRSLLSCLSSSSSSAAAAAASADPTALSAFGDADEQQQQLLPSVVLLPGTSLLETAELLAFLELASARHPSHFLSASAALRRDTVGASVCHQVPFAACVRIIVPGGTGARNAAAGGENGPQQHPHLANVAALLLTLTEQEPHSRVAQFVRNHVEIVALLPPSSASVSPVLATSAFPCRVTFEASAECPLIATSEGTEVRVCARDSNNVGGGLALQLLEAQADCSPPSTRAVTLLSFAPLSSASLFDATAAFRLFSDACFCVVPLQVAAADAFCGFVAATSGGSDGGSGVASRFLCVGRGLLASFGQRLPANCICMSPLSYDPDQGSAAAVSSLALCRVRAEESGGSSREIPRRVFEKPPRLQPQQQNGRRASQSASSSPFTTTTTATTPVVAAKKTPVVAAVAAAAKPAQRKQQQPPPPSALLASSTDVSMNDSSSGSAAFAAAAAAAPVAPIDPDLSNILSPPASRSAANAAAAAAPAASGAGAGYVDPNASPPQGNAPPASAAVDAPPPPPPPPPLHPTSSSALSSVNASSTNNNNDATMDALREALSLQSAPHTPQKRAEETELDEADRDDVADVDPAESGDAVNQKRSVANAATQTPPVSPDVSPDKAAGAAASNASRQQSQAAAAGPGRNYAAAIVGSAAAARSSSAPNISASAAAARNTPNRSGSSNGGNAPAEEEPLPLWKRQLLLEKQRVKSHEGRLYCFSNEDKGMPGVTILLRTVRTLEQLKRRMSELIPGLRPIGHVHFAVSGRVVHSLKEVSSGDELVATLHGGLPYSPNDPPRLLREESF